MDQHTGDTQDSGTVAERYRKWSHKEASHHQRSAIAASPAMADLPLQKEPPWRSLTMFFIPVTFSDVIFSLKA
ncbi:hypothetical protein H5410_056727 [Solanum commersonii]|uniref:Uncharacterized protein n=1 Tax=Solanum commersonii TaxID=4109 RepID=A0A9J5WL10_SOLCO|nr:hypothetical protein H5410_056727 [Solanum commersonii]